MTYQSKEKNIIFFSKKFDKFKERYYICYRKIFSRIAVDWETHQLI